MSNGTLTKSAAPVVSAPTRSTGLIAWMADKYSVEPDKMLETMKATCFKQKEGKPQVSNEQMIALLVVAKEYELNPFTREIYAFATDGGIVPVIPVDGWITIINRRPELESIEFEYSADGSESPWIACTITRRDRSKPVTIREYMDECYRDTAPWNSHGRRMLRHKSLIQAARIAFGLAGVFDPDDADAIVSTVHIGRVPPAGLIAGKPKTSAPLRRLPAAAHELPDANDFNEKYRTKAGIITIDQATIIFDILAEKKLGLSRFCAEFEIGAPDELPVTEWETAQKWLAAQAPGRAV